MRTVLITGALGFCAQHLLKKLYADYDLRVCGIDLARNIPPHMFFDEYFCIDICNQDKLDHLIQTLKPDWIFHLAGINGGNPYSVYNINFVGSLYLIESVRKLRLNRALFSLVPVLNTVLRLRMIFRLRKIFHAALLAPMALVNTQ